MSRLTDTKCYYVIKVAGDNDGIMSVGGKTPVGVDIDYFVATNRAYFDKGEAIEVALNLSRQTPGNRYYVTEAIVGFLTDEPKLHAKGYDR